MNTAVAFETYWSVEDFLDEHDGATFDDPGYFVEE